MTGAPIYLVSACASGEEFVAAFRRYADKNGLFIPIGDPLPPGGRTRFAVTLRDGGVMIEGEAEIVSAARVPSVLHGRVGMTLRFLESDEASKTMLGELVRARLAMKPSPPSVLPRPAEIPAEPRPVPPPIQGRVDAMNALAECVAIGDTAALGPPLPTAPAAPPKTKPRSATPTPPASAHAGPGTSPGLGLVPHAPAAPPASMPIAKSGDRAAPVGRDTAPPAITPRATPQPDRLRRTEPSTERITTERLTERAPAAPAISGPSEVAAPIAAEDDGEPTQIHGAEEVGERTRIHASAPHPSGAAPAPATLAAPTVPESVPASASPELPRPRRRISGSVTVHGMPMVLRAPASPMPELEIAEPTDISMPPEPQVSPPAEDMAAVEPELAASSQDLPAELDPELLDEPAAESASPRPRRTVIGVAVVPSGVMVLPAAPTLRAEQDASIAAGEEATGPDRPPPAPTEPAGAGGDWTIARDPGAPDGWTDLLATAARPPSRVDASAPPAAIPASVPPAPPSPIAAVAQPADAPPRPSPRPGEPPIVESNDEVDPALADTGRSVKSTGEPLAAAAAPPAIARYDADGRGAVVEAPAIQRMTAVPGAGAFATPPAPPVMHAGQVSGYPLDPSDQRVPAVPPSSPQLATSGGGGFDLRPASDPTRQAGTRRRSSILMLASAVVAVVIGIAAVLVFKLRHPSPPLPGTDRAPDMIAKQAERAEPRPAPAPETAPATEKPASPTAAAADQPVPPSPAGQIDRNAPPPAPERAEPGSGEPAVSGAAAAPPSPPERECFANVSSKPVGADIVLDQTVIGKTPKRVALPCGNPIELVIRKPRLVPATRTITPTPERVTTVKVALARETSTVKRPTSTIRRPTSAIKVIVISTPEGAEVTLNGEPVGVTPTTVQVPAFERSTLSIAKDGYETATRKLTPRAKGLTIRAELTKLDGNRPPI